jgi:formylglycine-generating enzyme required for sulfatase activity
MGSNPSKWKEPNRPVEQVMWHEAAEFCRLATQHTRVQFRLPTEAEWEYACRAGSRTKWCFGSDQTGLGDYAWYSRNSGGHTHPVGRKKPNAWGLYDMHGNVSEFVADWYGDDYYAKSQREDPTGPKAGSRRILRGGAWSSYERFACRSARRIVTGLRRRFDGHGFRAAVSVSAAQAGAASREAARRQAAYDSAIARAKMRIRLRNWKGAAEACDEALKHEPGDAEATRLMAEAKEHLAPKRSLTINLGGGVTMEMLYIKPGRFMMGGNKKPGYGGEGVEKPIHEVAITRGFYMGKYEVTQAQYEAVKRVNPSKWREANRPVEKVTWEDAVEFCRLATRRTRVHFRLPTEAEREYACRAGSTTQWHFGDAKGDLGDYAWCNAHLGMQTHPVGQKKPNTWGLHDMHGNVWEWVADWYDVAYYVNSPREDPPGPKTGEHRVLRGGCWGSDAHGCRAALRAVRPPSARSPAHGFRVAVTVSPRGK